MGYPRRVLHDVLLRSLYKNDWDYSKSHEDIVADFIAVLSYTHKIRLAALPEMAAPWEVPPFPLPETSSKFLKDLFGRLLVDQFPVIDPIGVGDGYSPQDRFLSLGEPRDLGSDSIWGVKAYNARAYVELHGLVEVIRWIHGEVTLEDQEYFLSFLSPANKQVMQMLLSEYK